MSNTYINNSYTINAWPTPVRVADLSSQDEWFENNKKLYDLVMSAESREKDPLLFGVVGATKTSLDILQWEDPAIAWLRKNILKGMDEICAAVGANVSTEANVSPIAEGWAVVYREAASHRLHTHHGSAWSGVYYISTGGVGDGAGYLQLLDPRPGAIARHFSEGPKLIEPAPGKMVIFPSWLPHSVKSTLVGGSERVCIAFNIGYEEE